MYINSRKAAEHLDTTTTPTLSNEAIQSIANVYANTTGSIAFNNIKATGKVDFPKWVGMIVMWSGTIADIPYGWALCDGTNNTPDLRGRFIVGVGKGDTLTERKLGDKGGEEKHKLDISEIPPHKHMFGVGGGGGNEESDTDKTGGNSEGWSKDYAGSAYKQRTTYAGGDSDNSKTSTSGYNKDKPETWGTVPHENMPPYYALAYIMKVRV